MNTLRSALDRSGRLRCWLLEPPCSHLIRRSAHTKRANNRNQTRNGNNSTVRTFDFFRELGLKAPLVDALRKSFPNVKQPTRSQVQFTPLILAGRDVVLHDKTGTGKSFGILLALLNMAYQGTSTGPMRTDVGIASLVIVPHRDLAFQMLEWTKAIHRALPRHESIDMDAIIKVVVRGQDTPLESRLRSLQTLRPRILIGTPQALLEIYDADQHALDINTLSTVVADEVDYLIDLPSENLNPENAHRAWKNFTNHPSPTRKLLGEILQARKPGARSGTEHSTKDETSDRASSQNAPKPAGHLLQKQRSLQVVLSSATVTSNLMDYMHNMHWLEDYVHLDSIRPRKREIQEVTYHALIVDRDGRMKNMDGVLDNPENSFAFQNVPMESATDVSGDQPGTPRVSEDGDKHPNQKGRWLGILPMEPPLPHVRPPMMEAIATVFALEVSSIALLVLPPSNPVRRAIQELRDLGVNAHSLDFTIDQGGRGQLATRVGKRASTEPLLLVAATASTRGIDIPELSHVFILGAPSSADEFEHIAGRVNRFGRGGTVVSFLSPEDRLAEERTITEAKWMSQIYAKVGISPRWYEMGLGA
ncbi:P-loop containing nucleoside triphosphate hydrolase protein [Rickenella mellea]|uniref:RNA helicase n=1 Tax=Rickenella mellea TaxID=50990 RepID=A0A4Y7QPA2_9AGAM|nr:P-loop containing nucleoside triphosphate hydrolase protein [Rickenella mellea]